MSEYDQYVTSINKIFNYLEKMKAGWNSLDNLNYIDSINEYKETVISSVDIFDKKNPPSNTDNLEVLGND